MFQLFTVSVVTNRYVCVFVHIILYILLLLAIVAMNNPKGVWHSSPSIWSYTRPLISYSCLFQHVPLSVQYGVSWFTSSSLFFTGSFNNQLREATISQHMSYHLVSSFFYSPLFIYILWYVFIDDLVYLIYLYQSPVTPISNAHLLYLQSHLLIHTTEFSIHSYKINLYLLYYIYMFNIIFNENVNNISNSWRNKINISWYNIQTAWCRI